MSDRLETNEAIEGLKVIVCTARNEKTFLNKTALKIKELDEENTRLKNENIESESRIVELHYENKRLRQAIEKASDELGWGDVENANLKADRTLVKALKGGTDE